MLTDARSVPRDSVIDTEVCIVGAGAAGISLALELAGQPLRVCVLEGGGLEPDAASQALYRGTNRGRPYFALDASRTRAFGGSTHCWQGLCLPLEAADFKLRDWIPDSGWPFGRAALDPYYVRAAHICGLDAAGFGAAWSDGNHPVLGAAGGLETRVFQIAPTRFGSVYREALTDARNVDVHLHANLVDCVLAPGTRRVGRLRVRTLAGGRFEVRPKLAILAAGGIENARLLLAARSQQTGGLGNQNDLVGRYFMEHPHVHSARFLPSSALGRLGLYHPPRREGAVSVVGAWKLPESTRRSARLADCTSWLSGRLPAGAFERPLADAIAEMDADTAPQDAADDAPGSSYVLTSECEQVPERESRVVLTDERDALGVPRVALRWKLSAFDYRSARRSQELLALALGAAGLGRVQLGESGSWPDDTEGGRHHMGTTRMHSDPRRGVVDADGRVHGLDNLYVAGSSVFPTAGASNPTLTIVALAVRLADHVKGVMG